MRKNLLVSIAATTTPISSQEARAEYASRGASRSMKLSIEELAENARKLVDGEAIINLDPEMIDQSFVADRVEDDEEAFAQLREGIAKDGQLQPILVRPHPTASDRYMIVFGHRRTRAARELGIKVKAVVRDMAEIAHIIAQGQENSRRADLSFIEKALFARKLIAMGQSKETAKSALSVDDTLLSRMLSVVDIIPSDIIEALGSAKSVGRDRWEELKKIVSKPQKAKLALELIASEAFKSAESAARFSILLGELKRGRTITRKPFAKNGAGEWSPTSKKVVARYHRTGKTYTLSLAADEAGAFGQFISENLEALYGSFKKQNPQN